jgi:hypothetical protein
MPARTQTLKRPGAGRFGRPTGKPALRPARGRRGPSSRRPVMPGLVSRRGPAKSGTAKAADKLGGMLPGARGQKRGASGGAVEKGAAGLALLAGAAGLLVKNREKLTAMIRHGDSSGEAGKPVVAQAGPVASNCGPVAPAVANALASTDHLAT